MDDKNNKKPLLTVLNLGAGVQSSALALMAEHGDFEKPDCAIFADTGAEPEETYKWLDELESMLSFPVYRVMESDGLLEDIRDRAKDGKFLGIPLHGIGHKSQRPVILRRQCTREFKITPIIKKIRELAGVKKGQRFPKGEFVDQWVGISVDEIIRCKPAPEKWAVRIFPLIEKRMSRADCYYWLESHGFKKPPKSSCVFCPFHSAENWKRLKKNPRDWAKAVEVDDLVRNSKGRSDQLFLSGSRIPLAEIDFNDRSRNLFEGFGNECEGVCGV